MARPRIVEVVSWNRSIGRLRYHVSVHSLASRILTQIRQQDTLHPGDRVGVGVSGGIDSVALLRLLLDLRQELGIVVSVVHFNHELRGAESEADQEFVAALAREHGLEFYCSSGDVAGFAFEQHSGVEAAAREMRYGFFRQLLVDGTLAAEAALDGGLNGSAGSASPPKGTPQGLKPNSLDGPLRGAEAPLFHGDADSAAEAAPFPILHDQNIEMNDGVLHKIATGHTLDDQAETVLMRLIRGTGMRGLGGVYPRIEMESDDGEGCGQIVRPLLGMRRRELERYLVEIKQPWREDSSNKDSSFTRNRLRKLVMPVLEREFNPSVVENLSRLAEIARDEEDYWDGEVSGWLGTVVQWSQPEWARGLPGFESSQSLVQIHSPAKSDGQLLSRLEEPGPAIMNASVSRPWLLTEPRAVQRRVIKAIGDEAGIPLEFEHVEEILRFASEGSSAEKEISIPLGWKVRREAEAVVFLTPDLRCHERIPDYEYVLAVPGGIAVAEVGGVIEALLFDPDTEFAEYNPQQLLRADLLPEQLTIRNWRAGDRYWPAHTKAPKKVKDLLQDKRIAQPDRRLWPVAISGHEIIWMRGFPVPARLQAVKERAAVLIRETRFDEDAPGI